MELEWEDPPPQRRPPGKAALFVAALQERPGAWAKYPHTFKNTSAVATYKKNYPQAEWTARRQSDDGVTMYARWIGDQP